MIVHLLIVVFVLEIEIIYIENEDICRVLYMYT